MKKLLFAVVFAAIAFTSCGNGGGNLRNEADSMAYAIGVNVGMYVKQVDSTMNINIIAAGIRDVIRGNQKMTIEQVQEFEREYFMVRIPARNKKAADDYIQSVEKSNQNVVKTESGLLYEILTPGDDNVKATKDNDRVRVLYTLFNKEGEEIHSLIHTAPDGTVSADTTTINLIQTIPGFMEGMKLVGKGGKIKLYVPADLGFGPQAPQGIKQNDAAVFEVELIDVIPAEEPAK